MLCLCSTKLQALMEASASLSAQLSLLGSVPAPPSAVVQFMASASASASAQASLPELPCLSMNGNLAALAQLSMAAQAGLGLDPSSEADLSVLAQLCAQLNVSAMGPLMSFPTGIAAQLSCLLAAAAQIRASLGVDLMASAQSDAELSATIQASLSAQGGLPSPPSVSLSAMAQAQVMATLQAAFGAALSTPEGMAQLSASLQALASLDLSLPDVPVATASAAACLPLMTEAGLMADASAMASLMATLSARLQMAASAFASASLSSSTPAAPSASASASLGVDLNALAELSANLPASPPALSLLPTLSLMASLNKSMPVLASAGCGACAVFG
jgi:hypothetical protein